MLPDYRIVLLDLHLFRHGALVFGGGIEMPGSRAGHQLDLVSHGFSPLNLSNPLATGTHIG